MPPRIGDVVNDKYRIVRQLGEGGMGSVYEAQHEGLRARVALKVLHHELAGRDEALNRFMQEARLVASIKSPHVVQVNDVEKNGQGELFMVLEYLEGKTLQKLYEELKAANQQLTPADALLLAAQMLEGADAAHRVGIVHRDLKPDNVMIVTGPQGEPFVKLLDFGIAKLRVAGQSIEPGMTRPGVVMGTAEYMAPEQAFSADAVDARADVFALGVIFFEMLAARRPAAGDEPRVLAAAHLSGKIPRVETLVPSLAPRLADVIHRAMSPKPMDRYADAGELLTAIEPFASEALSALATTAYAVSKKPANGPLGTALLPVKASSGTALLPMTGATPSGTAVLPRSYPPGPPPPNAGPSSIDPLARTGEAADRVPTTRPAQVVRFDSARPPPFDATSGWAPPHGPSAPPQRPTPTADEPSAQALIGPPTGVPAPPPVAKRKPPMALWIGGAIFVVLLIAAIGIGIWIAVTPKHADDDDRPPRPKPVHTTKRPPKRR